MADEPEGAQGQVEGAQSDDDSAGAGADQDEDPIVRMAKAVDELSPEMKAYMLARALEREQELQNANRDDDGSSSGRSGGSAHSSAGDSGRTSEPKPDAEPPRRTAKSGPSDPSQLVEKIAALEKKLEEVTTELQREKNEKAQAQQIKRFHQMVDEWMAKTEEAEIFARDPDLAAEIRDEFLGEVVVKRPDDPEKAFKKFVERKRKMIEKVAEKVAKDKLREKIRARQAVGRYGSSSASQDSKPKYTAEDWDSGKVLEELRLKYVAGID